MNLGYQAIVNAAGFRLLVGPAESAPAVRLHELYVSCIRILITLHGSSSHWYSSAVSFCCAFGDSFSSASFAILSLLLHPPPFVGLGAFFS